MTSQSDAIAVFITTSSRAEAVKLADLLVNAKLAACVQILPEIQSVYRWQEQVERQSEVLLIAKTTQAAYQRLETTVREVHSYDTPEIVAVSLVAGFPPYLNWINENVVRDETETT